MNNINNPKNTVVLFIPESGIYSYMRGLAVLGDAIKKQGGSVLVTRDTGQMLRSPIMAMYGLPANISEKEKTKINKINNRILKSAQKKYKFSIIEISDLIDSETLLEIDNLCSSNSSNLEDVNFRGFPVGKIAQYDFILETKFPYSFDISNIQKELYVMYIKNTALAIVISDKICERFNPSLMITFNEYAQCQAVRYSAANHNVSRFALTYPVNFNIDASRFSMWQSTCEYWRYRHCQNWNNNKSVPVKESDIIKCWGDIIFRMYGFGSHIFSFKKEGDPVSVFKNLGLSNKRKTIVVYTSSQDERGSVEIAMKIWGEDNFVTDVFSDQISWLHMLRKYVEERDDIQIVVRIHPREGARKYGFDSKHLQQLKDNFSENYNNFFVIWPDDIISSYDLMELADVCLVSWSLMGQEAARLGIPVLSYTKNMYYPDDDFIQVASTIDEYKKRLDDMLNMNYSWSHLVKAVRFYHWRTFIPSLDLSETVPSDFEDTNIWPEVPASKVSVINDILSGKQDLIEYNIKQWQNSLPVDAEFQESEAMRQGIRFFLDKIFYPPKTYGKFVERLLFVSGKVWRKYLRRHWYTLLRKQNYFIRETKYNFSDYSLEFNDDISRIEELCQKTKLNKKLRFLVADELFAILVHNGKVLRRMSPVIVRLARLYNDSLKNK